jgi:cation transport protein ChaC
MWIFGYGSLMGDGWEEKFGCLRRSTALLHGYRRTFNKASTKNWGNKEAPCPTLNLEKVEAGVCKGLAFEFPDAREVEVREYLADREGKGFLLEPLTIRLEDDGEVQANVPVYRGKNLLSTDVLQQKAAMVTRARGTSGSCRDYVKEIAKLLAKLGIDDRAVSELSHSVEEESLESMMREIRERLELLESNLPRRVDGFGISPHSKIPFKVLLYREVLIWRMAELSRSALEHLENDRLASAITLIRAAVETSAALWYLWTKLDGAVQSRTVGDIDDFLMKLIMGSKTNPDLPQPINVLTFVDRANKDIDGFRQQYDNLSEFAHPNWAGTSLLYSKSDSKNLWTDFGANIRGLESTKQTGAINLSVALMIFERNYNLVADLMPPFLKLFEGRATSATGEGPAVS